MEIKLYNFSKKENSTAVPSSDGTTVNVRLKQDCSVTDPVLILDGFNNAFNFNYAYIAAWSRYYFLSRVVYISNDLMELTLHVDTMASYRSQIRSYTGFIALSASEIDNRIADSRYLVKSTVVHHESANSDTMQYWNTNGTYVIRTVGKGTDSAFGIGTYAITALQLNDVLSFLFDEDNFKDQLSDAVTKTFFNPFQYIVSIQWFPFVSSAFGGTTVNRIPLGWWNADVDRAVVVTTKSINSRLDIVRPAGTFGDFRDYSSKYTQLKVYLPCVGVVDLCPLEFYDDSYALYYIDTLTGSTVVRLFNSAGENISSFNAQLSAEVQIGQMGTIVNTTLSTAGNVAGAIGSFMTGNVGSGIKSSIAAAQSATEIMQPTPSMLGQAGTASAITILPFSATEITQYATTVPDTITQGGMCMKRGTVSAHSGYCQMQDASISLPAFESEIVTVNGMLNSGFYIE